jgi:single-strand DNA-binding protein
MSNYNKVIMMGHLTADPLSKKVNDQTVAQFTLATNRKGKKPDGTPIEDVCFIDIELWSFQAELAVKYLKKGFSVLVEGRLKQAHWTKDGIERSKHAISCEKLVLLDNREGNPCEGKPCEDKSCECTLPTKQVHTSVGHKGMGIKKETSELDDLPF